MRDRREEITAESLRALGSEYLVLHPGLLMTDFNNDPTGKKFIIGLCDGILAHGKQDDKGIWSFPDEINWRTDATRGKMPAGQTPMQLMWAAWRSRSPALESRSSASAPTRASRTAERTSGLLMS